MGNITFKLWLEFENYMDANYAEQENDFFNMQIHLSNGKSYALNVWTFKYLESAIALSRKPKENSDSKYLLPPDLFVERMERPLLEEIVTSLILNCQLRDEWQIIPRSL